MLIVCPNCKNRFEIEEASVAAEKKLRCSSCRAVFRLVRKAQGQAQAQCQAVAAAPVPAQTRPTGPTSQTTTLAAAPAPPASTTMVRNPAPAAPASAPPAPPARRLKVVIANESQPFCDAVSKILADEPFEIFVCTDGKEALETVERVRPELLLLDVALPTMFGFEVCERARQNPELSGLKIVLIASIYDKTRYKRSPKSLYGADDYLEKHHIPDSLIPMIHRLVSGSAPLPTTPTPGELALQEKSRTEIRQAELRQIQTEVPQAQTSPAKLLQSPPDERRQPQPAQAARAIPPQPELSEAQLKARRLARIIVSDISLYSQGKVEQGVREGNFYTLLADDIREGELFYRQRVPDTVREAGSYLTEAFEDLIAKKRAELSV
jgi:predicted Zn finger-like uncharacterized protein